MNDGDVFSAGWDAQQAGVERTENPWSPDSHEAKMWDGGWQASKDYDDRNGFASVASVREEDLQSDQCRQGYIDFYHGLERNPYPKKGISWRRWELGFSKAKEEVSVTKFQVLRVPWTEE